ncbi:hypothetical protein SNEBB_006076 [Seison nebaliae]|nr:hypothetical protein SNEBB_006076 [Seison nebaliae]
MMSNEKLKMNEEDDGFETFLNKFQKENLTKECEVVNEHSLLMGETVNLKSAKSQSVFGKDFNRIQEILEDVNECLKTIPQTVDNVNNETVAIEIIDTRSSSKLNGKEKNCLLMKKKPYAIAIYDK